MVERRVRIAPSPTGRLHVGNAYIALANWLYAKQAGGWFLLRLDDTDRERSTAAFAAAIEEDMRWLGLAWDEMAHQSARLPSYNEAVAHLKTSGRLYPCYETPEELTIKRKLQLQRGEPPVYDRAALKLSADDRARLEAAGHRPHWRFKLSGGVATWTDLVRGPQHIDEASQSDPVLVRGDGSYLYTLTSIVDDIDFAISAVIRGSDHVTNTGAQIEIIKAMGASVPDFAHLPLLSDASGAGFSKRTGSTSLGAMREEGVEALALASYLARIGAGAHEPRTSLTQLASEFDIAAFGGGSPRFDMAELWHLNARLLHLLPYGDVADRLPAGADEALWLAVRGNVDKLADVDIWLQVCRGEIEPVVEDRAFCLKAAEILPPEPWSETTWQTWTASLKSAAGKSGRALFHPLRLALTGRENGPELKLLLPLIGRARALSRLEGRKG